MIPQEQWPVTGGERTRFIAAAIALQRHGMIVIMEACKLSSRRRAEWRACVGWPEPGMIA